MSLLTIPTLTPTQRQILEGLYQEGGLSTNLIAQYVVPGLARNQTVNELTRLRGLELVSSHALGAGASEEHCWVVRYAGARALGHRVVHTDARYRPPQRAQLDQKGLTLRLQVTLENLNWEYVRPAGYNSRHPKPTETPQRQALARAVAAHFAATAPSAGTVRLHPSQVPAGLNDWVAWPARQAAKAVVLIVHPVGGTAHFWRTGERSGKGRARPERAPGRTQVYGVLARLLPVVGLFATPELVTDYRPLLEPAGIRGYTLDEMPRFLHEQSRC